MHETKDQEEEHGTETTPEIEEETGLFTSNALCSLNSFNV
jgi:hypothetical protein